jgi:hypothetical protein
MRLQYVRCGWLVDFKSICHVSPGVQTLICHYYELLVVYATAMSGGRVYPRQNLAVAYRYGGRHGYVHRHRGIHYYIYMPWAFSVGLGTP